MIAHRDREPRIYERFRRSLWYDRMVRLTGRVLVGSRVSVMGAADMQNEKPIPLLAPTEKPRRLCSVCGTVSYSPGGIHPQCNQLQADIARVERLKAAKKTEKPKEKVAISGTLRPWQKLCPKCRTQLHVRKLACICGHRFG